MGLAASQCRFLMLTSRESDVEAKLMTLSNQQMALSQKATRLSSDFAKAMSAQSVNFGENPVSYSNIMQPNMVADDNGKISQYIFKTCRGNVVLSSGLASKLGMSPSDLGGAASGSASDFKKLFPNGRQDFISKMMGKEPEDYVTMTNSNGETVDSEIKAAAYKYNDNVMNQAIVSVQAASILELSGYGFESLEYAMGTQEDNLSSFACIWTLDQYQYNEPNVHAITNMFVNSATEQMAKQLLASNVLGDSDAVKYATNYAIEKTRQDYAGKQLTELNGSSVLDALKDLSARKETDTNIYVSNKELDYTTTTAIDPSGNPTLDVTHLTGKDIFIDTAQLTATFLNYFDAGMLKALAEASTNGAVTKEETDNQYILDMKDTASKIEAFNQNKNPLKTRLEAIAAGTNGVGGFNSDITGTVKVTDDYGKVVKNQDGTDKTETVNLITSENGTTGWFGNTATTNADETTGTSTLVAQQNFYGYLYDAMASGGWVYNISVASDDDYLDTQLQHGSMYLCEYSSQYSDGHVLSIDDASSGLSLVDNAEKIDKAQADYEAETAKIDYKTNIIETQMNTLQTELDSIQSEKESVKSIVDKHLEKRFNIFS